MLELDLDQRSIEQFCLDATSAVRRAIETAEPFAVVASPETRSYVRMIVERLFPAVPILSHMEIARTVRIKPLGTIGQP